MSFRPIPRNFNHGKRHAGSDVVRHVACPECHAPVGTSCTWTSGPFQLHVLHERRYQDYSVFWSTNIARYALLSDLQFAMLDGSILKVFAGEVLHLVGNPYSAEELVILWDDTGDTLLGQRVLLPGAVKLLHYTGEIHSWGLATRPDGKILKPELKVKLSRVGLSGGPR